MHNLAKTANRNHVNNGKPADPAERFPAVTDLDDAVAAGLLTLVQRRKYLRLDADGWRSLRFNGYTRADVKSAIESLLFDGAITVGPDTLGVIVVSPKEGAR